MNFFTLEKYILAQKQPKFRFKQIKEALLAGELDFNKISSLPISFRHDLSQKFKILSFDIENVLKAKDKKTFKAILKTADNLSLETVLMRNSKDGWTICVSSQIGCPLSCSFCATGAMGFRRDLSFEEINDQALFWLGYLKENKIQEKITNLVYMGMGEPFLNWENMKKSLEIFISPDFFNFAARSISVSTAGIPEGIKKFAAIFPQVNLALSLHSAEDAKRKELMPVAKKYDLRELKKALEFYLEKTGRKVFLEYIMLRDQNDSEEDAKILISYLKSFKDAYLLHVNLIPYNEAGKKLAASERSKIENFKILLLRNKINTTIRLSLGADIQSACGQLGKKF